MKDYDYYFKIYERLVIPETKQIDFTVKDMIDLRETRDYFKSCDDEKWEDCEERLNEM